MRFEKTIGKYTFKFGSEEVVPDCEVCGGGIFHFNWEYVGTLCLRHSLDWAMDDYTSDFDYAQIDELQMSQGEHTSTPDFVGESMTGLPTWADGLQSEWSWMCPECGDKWQDDPLKDGETVSCNECDTEFDVTLRLTPIGEGESR